METTAIAVTNLPALGEAVGRVVRQALGPDAEFFHFTYAEAGSKLTLPLLASADLFILELLRPYSWGLRAEGIALGQRLAERGKQVLVFGPLSIAREVDSFCYWDTADPRSLAECVAQTVLHGEDARAELSRLQVFFRTIMAIPPQHG